MTLALLFWLVTHISSTAKPPKPIKVDPPRCVAGVQCFPLRERDKVR